MKRFVTVVLALILVLLCLTAWAMTQEEWNKLCQWKTNRSTPVYRIVSRRETGPDEDPDAGYVFEEVGTLPAGTYLGSRLHSVGDKSEMGAMVGGSIVDYYVPSSAISKVTRSIKMPDGTKVTIPELAYGDDNAVRAFLADKYSAEEIDGIVKAMHSGGSSGQSGNSSGKSSGNTKKTDKTDARQAEPAVWEVAWITDRGNEKVRLVTLGTVNSEIETGNEKSIVPTAQLRFGNQTEPDPIVASVLTKKTGFVTVRSEADENAMSLGRIPDGMIVGVIEQGETFTKVSYKGLTGYVVTRGLAFHDPTQTPIGVGQLYQKGKKETSIFLQPEQDAKWLAKWPQGETVNVVAEEGRYYAVEKDGFYGWLKKEYVQLEQEKQNSATGTVMKTPEISDSANAESGKVTSGRTSEVHTDGELVLYYNPEGGTRYHTDKNCLSTNPRYLPFSGQFTYAEVNDEAYAQLQPCNVCDAPLR